MVKRGLEWMRICFELMLQMSASSQVRLRPSTLDGTQKSVRPHGMLSVASFHRQLLLHRSSSSEPQIGRSVWSASLIQAPLMMEADLPLASVQLVRLLEAQLLYRLLPTLVLLAPSSPLWRHALSPLPTLDVW